jgi:hypothetical protein
MYTVRGERRALTARQGNYKKGKLKGAGMCRQRGCKFLLYKIFF